MPLQARVDPDLTRERRSRFAEDTGIVCNDVEVHEYGARTPRTPPFLGDASHTIVCGEQLHFRFIGPSLAISSPESADILSSSGRPEACRKS